MKTITDREELAEYLKRRDRESLRFFTEFAKTFGRPETLAYIHHPQQGNERKYDKTT